MSRRARLAIAALVGTGAALLVPREALRDAWSNLRRYSSPGAGVYDRLAGPLIGPFYERVARDVVASCSSGTVLEVGPGPGHLAARIAALAPAVRVVGVDVDAGMVARARARATREGVADRVVVAEGDVAALPLADACVDLVVSTFSLHHWADRVGGLDEIRRVLRPGGRALVYDLHPWWTRLETGGPDPAAAARASTFGEPGIETIRWPLGLPAVVRIELVRPAG